jgi:uncharacterized protein YlzI (FlbEa/FlbD family)
VIKVTSASDNTEFYLNHKKIEYIKIIGNAVHITLDNKNTYIVSTTIDEIQARILNVENATMHVVTVKSENESV